MDSWKLSTDNLGTDPLKWPPDLLRERCRLDAWATLKVQEAAEKDALGPSPLCHAIAMTLRRMYHVGVYVDGATVKRMKSTVVKNMKESELAARKWLYSRFPKKGKEYWKELPFKDANVRSVLYDRDMLNIPVTRTTKEDYLERRRKMFEALTRDDTRDRTPPALQQIREVEFDSPRFVSREVSGDERWAAVDARTCQSSCD